MVLLCKQKALYVKCCIIANGITDSQGDTLYAEDIKKIFTSFNNQDNFEVYHNELPLQEVSLLENYISTADETIGTAVVPRGSWNAVVRVDNPELKEDLLENKIRGVSLNNRVQPVCNGNLKGTIRYSDLKDAECVIPVYISFVEGGANGFGLHVMDYSAYIKKSASIKIDEKSRGQKMAFNLLEGLKSLIKQAEDAETEPAIKKEKDVEDETQKEEDPVVKKEEDATEDEDASTDENDEDVKIEKSEEEVDEEPAEESAEDNVETQKEEYSSFEDRVTALESEIAELKQIIKDALSKNDENADDGESEDNVDEPEDEDTPKITKSEKVLNTSDNVQKNTNYFELSGRDPLTGLPLKK